jgi:hypothetical protein
LCKVLRYGRRLNERITEDDVGNTLLFVVVMKSFLLLGQLPRNTAGIGRSGRSRHGDEDGDIGFPRPKVLTGGGRAVVCPELRAQRLRRRRTRSDSICEDHEGER